ncbi:MAG TPA: ABC transporter permease subunit [Chthoniobacterales bacterium]|jgi:NitT/TauT family transport system permease protein
MTESRKRAPRRPWLKPYGELPASGQAAFLWASFLLPLIAWAIVSYVPFVWHPLVEIKEPGGVSYFHPGTLIDRKIFKAENAKMRDAGLPIATGRPANPVFLPAPHEVAISFYKSFTTPPRRKGEKWLHESLWQSIQVIFWGFTVSSLIGVPLGILCGVYAPISRITEPFVDFTRYMPAPAFGALAVAVLGIYDPPKVAIIFLGTFFQQVLVIANTTRKLDTSLIEAAQTLGANRLHLLFRIIVPGIAVDLYNDMRILLGWAWTYLIVAEYIGASSGITYFINQQAKYRIYDNVFAAIIMIGIIGFTTDRVLAVLGSKLFPWKRRRGAAVARKTWWKKRAPKPAAEPATA